MNVKLGEILARCPNCGTTDFGVADPGTEDADICELICVECDHATTYGTLILQIGPRALHCAWEAVAAKPLL